MTEDSTNTYPKDSSGSWQHTNENMCYLR